MVLATLGEMGVGKVMYKPKPKVCMNMCCKAMIASCMACSQCMTVEEYCESIGQERAATMPGCGCSGLTEEQATQTKGCEKRPTDSKCKKGERCKPPQKVWDVKKLEEVDDGKVEDDDGGIKDDQTDGKKYNESKVSKKPRPKKPMDCLKRGEWKTEACLVDDAEEVTFEKERKRRWDLLKNETRKAKLKPGESIDVEPDDALLPVGVDRKRFRKMRLRIPRNKTEIDSGCDIVENDLDADKTMVEVVDVSDEGEGVNVCQDQGDGTLKMKFKFRQLSKRNASAKEYKVTCIGSDGTEGQSMVMGKKTMKKRVCDTAVNVIAGSVALTAQDLDGCPNVGVAPECSTPFQLMGGVCKLPNYVQILGSLGQMRSNTFAYVRSANSSDSMVCDGVDVYNYVNINDKDTWLVYTVQTQVWDMKQDKTLSGKPEAAQTCNTARYTEYKELETDKYSRFTVQRSDPSEESVCPVSTIECYSAEQRAKASTCSCECREIKPTFFRIKTVAELEAYEADAIVPLVNQTSSLADTDVPVYVNDASRPEIEVDTVSSAAHVFDNYVVEFELLGAKTAIVELKTWPFKNSDASEYAAIEVKIQLEDCQTASGVGSGWDNVTGVDFGEGTPGVQNFRFTRDRRSATVANPEGQFDCLAVSAVDEKMNAQVAESVVVERMTVDARVRAETVKMGALADAIRNQDGLWVPDNLQLFVPTCTANSSDLHTAERQCGAEACMADLVHDAGVESVFETQTLYSGGVEAIGVATLPNKAAVVVESAKACRWDEVTIKKQVSGEYAATVLKLDDETMLNTYVRCSDRPHDVCAQTTDKLLSRVEGPVVFKNVTEECYTNKHVVAAVTNEVVFKAFDQGNVTYHPYMDDSTVKTAGLGQSANVNESIVDMDVVFACMAEIRGGNCSKSGVGGCVECSKLDENFREDFFECGGNAPPAPPPSQASTTESPSEFESTESAESTTTIGSESTEFAEEFSTVGSDTTESAESELDAAPNQPADHGRRRRNNAANEKLKKQQQRNKVVAGMACAKAIEKRGEKEAKVLVRLAPDILFNAKVITDGAANAFANFGDVYNEYSAYVYYVNKELKFFDAPSPSAEGLIDEGGEDSKTFFHTLANVWGVKDFPQPDMREIEETKLKTFADAPFQKRPFFHSLSGQPISKKIRGAVAPYNDVVVYKNERVSIDLQAYKWASERQKSGETCQNSRETAGVAYNNCPAIGSHLWLVVAEWHKGKDSTDDCQIVDDDDATCALTKYQKGSSQVDPCKCTYNKVMNAWDCGQQPTAENGKKCCGHCVRDKDELLGRGEGRIKPIAVMKTKTVASSGNLDGFHVIDEVELGVMKPGKYFYWLALTGKHEDALGNAATRFDKESMGNLYVHETAPTRQYTEKPVDQSASKLKLKLQNADVTDCNKFSLKAAAMLGLADEAVVEESTSTAEPVTTATTAAAVTTATTAAAVTTATTEAAVTTATTKTASPECNAKVDEIGLICTGLRDDMHGKNPDFATVCNTAGTDGDLFRTQCAKTCCIEVSKAGLTAITTAVTTAAVTTAAVTTTTTKQTTPSNDCDGLADGNFGGGSCRPFWESIEQGEGGHPFERICNNPEVVHGTEYSDNLYRTNCKLTCCLAKPCKGKTGTDMKQCLIQRWEITSTTTRTSSTTTTDVPATCAAKTDKEATDYNEKVNVCKDTLNNADSGSAFVGLCNSLDNVGDFLRVNCAKTCCIEAAKDGKTVLTTVTTTTTTGTTKTTVTTTTIPVACRGKKDVNPTVCNVDSKQNFVSMGVHADTCNDLENKEAGEILRTYCVLTCCLELSKIGKTPITTQATTEATTAKTETTKAATTKSTDTTTTPSKTTVSGGTGCAGKSDTDEATCAVYKQTGVLTTETCPSQKLLVDNCAKTCCEHASTSQPVVTTTTTATSETTDAAGDGGGGGGGSVGLSAAGAQAAASSGSGGGDDGGGGLGTGGAVGIAVGAGAVVIGIGVVFAMGGVGAVVQKVRRAGGNGLGRSMRRSWRHNDGAGWGGGTIKKVSLL